MMMELVRKYVRAMNYGVILLGMENMILVKILRIAMMTEQFVTMMITGIQVWVMVFGMMNHIQLKMAH